MNERVKRFKKILKEKGLDGFIVTSPVNIYYLTGFRGVSATEREAILVVNPSKVILITDYTNMKLPVLNQNPLT